MQSSSSIVQFGVSCGPSSQSTTACPRRTMIAARCSAGRPPLWSLHTLHCLFAFSRRKRNSGCAPTVFQCPQCHCPAFTVPHVMQGLSLSWYRTSALKACWQSRVARALSWMMAVSFPRFGRYGATRRSISACFASARTHAAEHTFWPARSRSKSSPHDLHFGRRLPTDFIGVLRLSSAAFTGKAPWKPRRSRRGGSGAWAGCGILGPSTRTASTPCLSRQQATRSRHDARRREHHRVESVSRPSERQSER